MNHEQRELARHALGLPNKKRQSYRNRFFVAPQGSDFENWQAMFAEGEAIRLDTVGSEFVRFELTRLGGERALSEDETLDPEDF